MSENMRIRGRRLLLTAVLTVIFAATTATAASSASAQAKPLAPEAGVTAASCWVNVFAWVSTSPSNQGNLSSIVSCNTTVQRITQTMYVRNYNTGAIVATVGPLDTFNTTSAGIAYHWFCNQFSPQALWGDVRATVVEYSGAVSNGSWGTQLLSC